MNNENNVVFDQNNSFEIESNNPNVTITRRTITPNHFQLSQIIVRI